MIREPPAARAVGGGMTIQPVRWPRAAEWQDVLVRSWKEASDDNVGFLAAGVAFYAFLAFVPLLASVVLTYGLIADPPTVAEHIGKLFASLPRDAAALIADQLKGLTSSPKTTDWPEPRRRFGPCRLRSEQGRRRNRDRPQHRL